MLIGLDFDGIFTNIEKFQLTKIVEDKDWLAEQGYKIVNPNGFDVADVLGLDLSKENDRQLWKDFWNRHITEYVRKVPMREGLKDYIEQVRADGDKIVIVTQRKYTTSNCHKGILMRYFFFQYLKANGIKIDKKDVHFVEDDKKEELEAGMEPKKVAVIEKLGLDMYADDKPSNITAISKVCPVIAMNSGCNIDIEGENIYRVEVPQQMYKITQEIKAKKGIETKPVQAEIDQKKLADKYAGNRFYKNYLTVYRPFYHLTRKVKVRGQENIKDLSGAAIFGLNHLHKKDQHPLMGEVDRIISFFAKKEYFDHPIIGWLYRKMEMIEVDRFGDAIYAMGYAMSLIDSIPLKYFETEQPYIKQIIAYIDNLPVDEYEKPQKVADAVIEYLAELPKLGSEAAQVAVLAKAKIEAMPLSGKENGYGRAAKATTDASSILKQGRLFALFPEGTRNKLFHETGRLLPIDAEAGFSRQFSKSIIYLARDNSVPAIPVAVTGDHDFSWFKRAESLTTIGKPIKIDSDLNKTDVKDATIYFRNELYRLVALNLVDQPLEKNTATLIKIIDNLQSGIESNELGTLEQIYSGLSSVDSERNAEILKRF